jgi:hypothetical protein
MQKSVVLPVRPGVYFSAIGRIRGGWTYKSESSPSPGFAFSVGQFALSSRSFETFDDLERWLLSQVSDLVKAAHHESFLKGSIRCRGF